MTKPVITYTQSVVSDPQAWDIDNIKHVVRMYPYTAQDVLNAEYKRPGGPRYSLITWLKRHRPHNPTTRVIPNP